MTAVPLDATVVPAADVVTRATEDGLVLVNLNTGFLWELNHMGARVWRQISAHGSLRRAVDSLAAEYRVDRGVLENDVVSLVGDLRRHRLIEVVEPGKSI